ncbi:MAG: ROK family protein, partial [Acidimicrobiales bacterium]
IDIGGTKLEVGVIDESGHIRQRRRASSVGAVDAEELFARLDRLIRPCLDAEPSVCGVGTGGPMTRRGATVSPLNIAVWRGFPLRSRLELLTGLEVHIDNDAKALALAEAWRGAACGERNFIAMVVSTGVGGGIVLDGRLLDGADGNAGHIGHVVVEPDGHELAGHVRGVLEAEASGTAIAHHTGRPATEAGGPEIERVGTLVGRAIGSVANLLDLRLAVVAGSVALSFGEPFFTAAQRELDRVARLDHSLGARVIPAGLGADGPLIGAGAVGWRGVGIDVGVT